MTEGVDPPVRGEAASASRLYALVLAILRRAGQLDEAAVLLRGMLTAAARSSGSGADHMATLACTQVRARTLLQQRGERRGRGAAPSGL